jgi:transcriptional regulator with XRE-family HTH domain
MARACLEDDKPILEACGQRLVAALAARGWKIPRLADGLGVHRSTVHAYIHGTVGLSVPQLLRIAALLDIPPALLLPAPPTSPLAALEELLLQAPPDVYADVLAQAETLLRVYVRTRARLKVRPSRATPVVTQVG